MKIVIAPDSFKGSISAKSLCAAISEGIRSVYPEADIAEIPLADGGEGTVDNMVHATGGMHIETMASDPLGKPVQASYGILGDGRTVVIEAAAASGLVLVPEAKRNPMTASSYGTGELVADALNRGYRSFVIGLGGSATNDAGMGMLRALGYEFYDKNGQRLPEGGASLIDLAEICEANRHPLLREASFTIASDVENRLCGEEGASAVFGPQKGATPDMAKALDAALSRFADVVSAQKDIRVRDIVGGGAAGGLGAALVVFLNGTMASGIRQMMHAIGWERMISDADYIVTGEGRLDGQTLSGKTIKGICDTAGRHGIPVIALSGSVQLDESQQNQLGLTCATSIVPGPASLEQAMQQAHEWAKIQAMQLFRLIRATRERMRS